MRTALLACLVATIATAQTAPSEAEYFRALVANELTNRGPVDAGITPVVGPATVRAPTQSAFAGLTGAQLAVAAVTTTTEDVEAGLQVAPFANSSSRLSGLSFQIATLKDSVSRLGAGFAYAGADAPGTLSELTDEDKKPLVCTLDDGAAISLFALERDFADACRDLATLPSPSADDLQGKALLGGVLEACSPRLPTSRTVVSVVGQFIALTKYSRERLKKTTDLEERLSLARTLASRAVDRLTALRAGSLSKCPDKTTIASAVRRWRRGHTAIGFGARVTADLFPFQWGFAPSCQAECSTVGLARTEPAISFNLAASRLELIVAVGLVGSRETRRDPLSWAISPKLGAQWTFIDFEADKSIGLSAGAEAEVALSIHREPIQAEIVDTFKATGFVDLSLTDKISTRLGIPLRAEEKVKKDDNGNAVQKGLQWSVPGFVAVVIKTD